MDTEFRMTTIVSGVTIYTSNEELYDEYVTSFFNSEMQRPRVTVRDSNPSDALFHHEAIVDLARLIAKEV